MVAVFARAILVAVVAMWQWVQGPLWYNGGSVCTGYLGSSGGYVAVFARAILVAVIATGILVKVVAWAILQHGSGCLGYLGGSGC